MPSFPRFQLWQRKAQRESAYRRMSNLTAIPVNQHEVTRENQTHRFRYVVRVTTVDNDTNEEVVRHVSIVNDKRPTKNEILGAAQDLIMESKVSANEDFADAEIVFALVRR